MTNPQKPSAGRQPVGRPSKPGYGLKRSRTLSFTDAEYEKLGELADGARLGRSEYIVEKLGLASSALAEFKSIFPKYDYFIGANVITSEKISVFKEFLAKFKADCNFSMTTAEPQQPLPSISCTAFSTSSSEQHRIFIALDSERERNIQEYEALRDKWVSVLDLSLDLKDKWNGQFYLAHRQHTLAGKLMILAQFVKEYQSGQFEVNPGFNGGTVFKVTAIFGNTNRVLQIEYLPQRKEEEVELQRALEVYKKQTHSVDL